MNATGIITVNPVCLTATNVDYNNINTYYKVPIGSQCWMKENLRTRLYNDGTEILFDATVGSVGSSPTWQNLTVGGHTIYAHDNTASPSNLTTYVYLYNWYEAAGIVTNLGSPSKNICPTGWHVPNDKERTTLTGYLSGTNVAGGKMKA